MKILVIQQKMIGDVLVSSILCDNLRKAYPTAQIDYMVYQSTTPVLEGHTSFDKLILFEKKHQNSRWEYFKLIRSIRKEKYDVVIDAYSKLESWLVVLFSVATKKISYLKKGRSFLYTDTVVRHEKAKSNAGLIIEQRLSLLNPLQLNVSLDNFPKIYVAEHEKSFAKKLFEEQEIDTTKKTIMLSILGSSQDKTYPLSYMAQVIDFIADHCDANLLFNYMPQQSSEATELYEACKSSTQSKIYPKAIGHSIRDFIAIMNACDFIIGNDGGAINMAKALNKPSFIIFSPWIDKKGWATFEDGIRHISLHLKEFKPELFLSRSAKEIKKESDNLYQKFHPDLIFPALKNFLNTHTK